MTDEEVYAVNENQRGHVYLNPGTAFAVTSGGGKPGQSYPCVLVRQQRTMGEHDRPRRNDPEQLPRRLPLRSDRTKEKRQ